MARPKKEARLLDTTEAERVVSKLERRQDLKISVLDFMRLNFQRLKKTGLSRQTIYENLTSEGLDVGTFHAFSRCWSRVAKSGVLALAQSKADNQIRTTQAEEEARQKQEVEPERREIERETMPGVKAPEAPSKKKSSFLPPIYAADGTELEITETGAKKFKITSGKNK